MGWGVWPNADAQQLLVNDQPIVQDDQVPQLIPLQLVLVEEVINNLDGQANLVHNPPNE